MSHCHGDHCSATEFDASSPRLRRVLWIALILNAAMFAVEIVGGLKSGSVSLLADAANYALSLAVLSMGLLWRARAAWIKGATMGAYGAFVLGKAAWAAAAGSAPEPITMGAIAVLALAVNAGVAVMLFSFREGDANLRSVWLCSRNDAIGNVAVGIAALGVFGTGTAWPDLMVASVMATLALTASVSVLRQARGEIELATSATR